MKPTRKRSHVLKIALVLAAFGQVAVACSSARESAEPNDPWQDGNPGSLGNGAGGIAEGGAGSDFGSAGSPGATGGSAGEAVGGAAGAVGGDGGSGAVGGSGWGGFGASGGSVGDCGAGGWGANGGDGGLAGQGGSDGGERNCPATAPADGSRCNAEGRRCGYDPDGLESYPPLCIGCNCREVFECDGTNWHAQAKSEACHVPDPACPEVVPVSQAACPTTGLTCRYGGRLCRCSPAYLGWDGEDEICATDPTWDCGEPRDPCPKLQPSLGEACDVHAECTYSPALCCGPWQDETMIGCEDGVWAYVGGGECNPE